MQVLVSVIIPTYNVAPYVVQCVESVFAQTEKNIEIIAIDDASTDGTWEQLQEIAKRDARLYITRHPKNTGHPSAARNEGIDRARGKYVAFVDADDWIKPETIAAHYKVMERENCDMGYCSPQIWDESAQVLIETMIWTEKGHVHHHTQQPYFHWTEVSENFWYNFNTGACFKMYRSDFLRRTKLRFPDRKAEDMPFSFCTTIAARRIAVCPEAYYTVRAKRLYGINRDREISLQKCMDVFANLRDCYAYMQKNPPPPPYEKKRMEVFVLICYTQCYYALWAYVDEEYIVQYMRALRAFWKELIAHEQPTFSYFDDLEKENFNTLCTQDITKYIVSVKSMMRDLSSPKSQLDSCISYFSLWFLLRYKLRKNKDRFLQSLHAERYSHYPKWKRYMYYARQLCTHRIHKIDR